MNSGAPLVISVHRHILLFFSFRMFMYIFLGGLVALMLFGVYQALESRTVRVCPVLSYIDVPA